ncbi:MAG: tetratricopeptide repeat protein [Pseudomonadota bacterium]
MEQLLARNRTLVAAVILATAILAAWSNSFQVPFIYDDIANIVQSPSIRSLWPVADVLFPPPGSHVGGRPLFNLSFALNYAVSEFSVWSYHVFNVAVHFLAALVLFGLARRTLRLPALAGRFARQADVLALFIALIWALHPLHTDAVTYLTQRAESMMGLFFLAALYCALRGWEAGRSRGWHGFAFLPFVAGVGTKEVIVALPLVALAYEWVFFGRNPVRAARTSPVLYAGYGLGLGLLALLVAHGGTAMATPVTTATPLSYLATQAQVIVHYLRTVFWPSGLCLDYGWPIISFREALPYGLAVAALLALSAILLARRRPSGFLGAWFFLILAPTSSIMPLPFPAWDRRMYLSLAAVAALAACGAFQAARRWWPERRAGRVLAVLACILALALGTATWVRNLDYATEVSIWQDVVEKHPGNDRAWAALSVALEQDGQPVEAEDAARRAIALTHDYPDAWINLAVALKAQGRVSEAEEALEKTLVLDPDDCLAHHNLAVILFDRGDLEKALVHARSSYESCPFGEVELNYAVVLAASGEHEKAEKILLSLVRHAPSANAFYNLGLLEENRDRPSQAVAWYSKALATDPRNGRARFNLATLLARHGRLRESAALYQDLLRQDPDNIKALVNQGHVLRLLGQKEEAGKSYARALELDPGNRNAARGIDALSGESP